MPPSVEITPDLLAGFLDESPEYLEMLDSGLMEFESRAASGPLTLEDPADQLLMTEMFRAAHSLKGLAAVFGFDKIKELTHCMETLFDQVRRRERQLSSDSFETLFRVFDRLRCLIEELSDSSSPPVEIEDVLAELNTILNSSSPEVAETMTDAKREVADAESASDSDVSKPQNGDDPNAATSDIGGVGTDDAKAAQAPAAIGNELLSDPEMLAVFLESTNEALDELGQGLLRLEDSAGDTELLNTVFRCAHNIKGASGAVGLFGMNRLTHEMETVFDLLRGKRIELADQLVNAVFTVVDRLRAVTESLEQGQCSDVAPDELVGLFEPWIKESRAGATEAQQADDVGDDSVTNVAAESTPPSDVGAADGGDGTLLSVVFTFTPNDAESFIQAFLIQNRLSDEGAIRSCNPDLDALPPETELTEVQIVLMTATHADAIEELVDRYAVASVEVVAASQDVVGTSTAACENDQDGSAQPPVEAGRPDVTAVTQPADATSTPPVSVKPALAPTPPERNPTPTAAPPTPPARGGDSERAAAKSPSTIRVDQERLDQLMNLGGELVINRSRFAQVHGKFHELFSGKSLAYLIDDVRVQLSQLGDKLDFLGANSDKRGQRALVEATSCLTHLNINFEPIRSLVRQVHELRASMTDFDEALHGLTRVSESIQKGIMGTRMVPVGPLFTRFRRVVRDITKGNGKQVTLILRGESTELDKRMIDELGDPLTHMVRNSVDHGIESPEERRAAGKDPTGILTLSSCHRGNSICIEIIDDGAGVNIERVKAKVVERELATPAQVDAMSDRELIQYILKPGFSTAQTVTEVSGRGMGMDIVINKIEKLSGTIEIDSTPGEGTHIVIKLPLTLAVLTSMVARIGQGIYAIPLESVAEIITVPSSDVQCIQRRQVVRVRDRVVPLAWFEDVFETMAPRLQTESRSTDELTLMIIGLDDQQVGLVVDELVGQEDVVIKSIAENYQNVAGIAGASIRGDGTVSLILDVAAVMSKATQAAESASQCATPAPSALGATQ